MKKNYRAPWPDILPCPRCANGPTKEKKDEWDDWGRWVDRTLYRIQCCGIETPWTVDKGMAIAQWNNLVRPKGRKEA